MPQTDADDTDSQPKLDALARGDINIAPPFKKESRVIKLKDLISEGRYDHIVGRQFDVKGKGYRIVRIENDRFAHVVDDHQNTSMFRLNWLTKNVPGFTLDKSRKARPTAWNKGQKTLSKRGYEKILKGAMKDASGLGDEEFTHDMASSMIHDPEIKNRLKKEYPAIRREEDLIQRLQYDLEMYI